MVEKAIECFATIGNKHYKDGTLKRYAICRECKGALARPVNNAWARKYRESSPGIVNATSLRYRERNRKKVNAYARTWREANPSIYKAIAQKSYQKRKKKGTFRISASISSAVGNCLRGRKCRRKTWDILGYTLTELKLRIEGLFLDGMSWENYGEWHLDHIIPISFFVFEDVDDVEFKMCWRLENLQPLWAVDNISKRDKLPNCPIALSA